MLNDILSAPSEKLGLYSEADFDLDERSDELFRQQQQRICVSTDRSMGVLMVLQWLVCIALALFYTPLTWQSNSAQTNPHVFLAIGLGGLITSLPIFLVFARPGQFETRIVMGIAQMMMSGLLIHLTGGRIETHFHVFGSLAFLAAYRDWRVLIPASLVVVFDHFARGIYFPISIFGTLQASPWRALEHTGWVVFADIFLIASCLRSTSEMRFIARQTSANEQINAALRHEIEERKTAEADLKGVLLQRQQLSAAVENSHVGVLISDPHQEDAPAIFINPAFTQITGYQSEETIGRNCRFLQGPETDPATVQKIREAITCREPYECTLLNYKRDGTPFWNELRISPVFDENGELINFIGLQSDVTDRVEAEKALTQSEERYRQVVSSVAEGIFQADENMRWTFLNPAWEMISGYNVDGSLGRSALDFVQEDERALNRQKFASILNGQQHYCRYETRLIHRNGENVWVEVLLSAIYDGNGGVAGITGTLMDVTQRRLAQKASEEARLEAVAAREEAENANHSKSDFLSRTSHELRTPLNAILGFGQLLEMEDLTPIQNEQVKYVTSAGRHLLRLIDEVLELSRIQSHNIELTLEPVPVGEILTELLGLVRPLADERQVTMNDCSQGNNLFVRADRQRLKQILLNFLSNAIKYNDVGGSVQVGCETVEGDANRVRIYVSDTGKGIEADSIKRLFSPFDRLGAEYSDISGTGLGLSVSKNLAEAMNGVVGVESELGHGSKFWIEMPRDSMTHQSEIEPVASTETAPSSSEKLKRVLYIEDNVSNLRLMQQLMQRRAHVELLSATNGEDGLELARATHPDLVLLDLHLPDIEGAKVMQRMYEDSELRAIPVIIVSADATSHQIQRFEKLGARHYISKPFDVNELFKLVDSILQS